MSPSTRLLLESTRVLLDEGCLPRAVLVEDERIAEVLPHGTRPAGVPVLPLGERVLMPGVVDSHAHINEPGRTEWEGFETATRAAAAGGITTVVDMPLNSIPATTSLAALRAKAEAARGQCRIDYGFWGGVIPGNTAELEGMVEAGALGFKAFLIESGVEEFPHVHPDELPTPMRRLAACDVPLLVHAELADGERPLTGDARSYRRYLESRPRRWENEAVARMATLAREHRGRVHIVHLASAEALPVLAAAQRDGVRLSAETCPHYLTFSAEEIADGATHFKCAPPVREAENRELLWEGLQQGHISMVVSDHSPCAPALKRMEQGDFGAAWGGIASLQFSLPAVWTGMRQRGLGLALLARWMCQAPAELAGVGHRKGAIRPGYDADLVVFDPEARIEVEPALVHHRHPITPYAGRTLFGRVERTFVRGQEVYVDGRFPGTPRGRQLGPRPGGSVPGAQERRGGRLA